MKTIYFILINLLVFSNCSNKAQVEKKLLEEKISRIENGLQSNLQIQYQDSLIRSIYNIEERMQELKIPGLSIAVLNKGRIEWAKGYGIADSLANKKVTTETLFQAGSISKPIAASMALRLVDDGLITLDANINSYLTSWQLPENEFTKNEKVTTRRILNHTAGLTISGFKGYVKGEEIPSLVDILDGKGNTDPVRVYKEPGGAWSYSGGGYTILQQMISDVIELDFPEAMKESILNPLGMKTSTFENPLPEELHQLAAAGYNYDGSQVEGKWFNYPEMAAAGLWTNPSELILWAKEIQEVLLSQEDGLLTVNSVNEMLTPNEDDQGLGPYVLEQTFGHGGADEGFRASLLVWKETGNAVVIMVNSQNGNAIIREILLGLVEEYNLPDYYPMERVFREQNPKELERYVGIYNFPEAGDAEITIKDDGLQFSGKIFSDDVFLLPASDTKFFNKNSGTYYTFEFQKGKVQSVQFSRYKAIKTK